MLTLCPNGAMLWCRVFNRREAVFTGGPTSGMTERTRRTLLNAGGLDAWVLEGTPARPG
jgi:hypothetical protein